MASVEDGERGMTLDINFTRDVAARCVQRLTEAGYAPQPTDDDDAIYTYCGVRHRRVRPRPRRVHKAAYTVPPDRVDGERQLLEKVTAGGDLWPHQSRQMGKLTFEDGMLNDYGIQHFHLGTTPDPKHPNLIAGTKELLFAVVKEDDFHVIGIYDHSAWSKQALLDVIHATWPKLSEPYTIKGGSGMEVRGLRRNYTDAETAELRKHGINTLVQRADGGIQIGMGGGVSTAGTSVAVRRETDKFLVAIEEVQEQVTATLAPRVASGDIPADAAVRLVWDGDATYAVPEPPVVKVNLTGRLVIPPL